MPDNHLRVFYTIAAAALALTVGPLPASARADAPAAPEAAKQALVSARAGDAAPLTGVSAKPNTAGNAEILTQSCSAPALGKQTCLRAERPSNVEPAALAGDPSIQAPIAFPTWCYRPQIYGTRTEACFASRLVYTTYRIVNGQTQVTGVLESDVFSFQYGSTSISTFAHQIGVAAAVGWGDALRASVTGTARGSGSCTFASASYPSQPLQPFNTIRAGESYYNTTATAPGSVGYCTTNWDITFTNTGYPNATSAGWSMSEIRCDNAVGAAGFRPARVGCVVPWYASAIGYSQSSNPTLASHVAQAQASGLPGGSFAAPLYRTTNQGIIDTNRNLACGDAPSITGLSCDEYPLASTYQGLSAGGSRRTFDGCNINAPRQTGPTGASACMIAATDNSSQGGMHVNFNYDWRILDGDPFQVLIVP